MEFADNDDVLRLLEGRPQGILSLLKVCRSIDVGVLKLNKVSSVYELGGNYAVL